MTRRLLLVDDEPGVREAVRAYLEDSGFLVQVARDAREGWEMVQTLTPDLVISDVMMPYSNGYQFLEQLRADPRFHGLPVVFLTARGMTKDRILGYQAGCDAYLAKPFDPEELVAIVQNLLQRRNLGIEGIDEASGLAEMARQVAEIRAWISQRQGASLNVTTTPVAIDFTPREQSVLDLVVEGLMNKEIAHRLDTSIRNVEKYVSRLFNKTGTSSRTELVRYALEHGLTLHPPQ